MMHFTRKISIKHHPNGDHYALSIPPQVAEILGLQDGGGLVNIEIVKSHVILKAYRDSLPVTCLIFNPVDASLVDVPISPRTRGRSRLCPEGMNIKTKPWQALRQACLRLEADMKLMWPGRRGRKRKNGYY